MQQVTEKHERCYAAHSVRKERGDSKNSFSLKILLKPGRLTNFKLQMVQLDEDIFKARAGLKSFHACSVKAEVLLSHQRDWLKFSLIEPSVTS